MIKKRHKDCKHISWKTSVRYHAYIPMNLKKLIQLSIIIHDIYSWGVVLSDGNVLMCDDTCFVALTQIYLKKIALART